MNGTLKAIAIVILIGGVGFLAADYLDLFPQSPDVAENLGQDITDLTKKTGADIDNAMDNSFSSVTEKINVLQKSPDDITSKTDDKKTTIEEAVFYGKIKNEEPDKTIPTQTISEGSGSSGSNGKSSSSSSSGSNTNSQSGLSSGSGQTNPQPNVQPPAKVPFDTLSLVTKKQSDDNVMMRYQDTSDQTQSVTVTIRNEQKTLFTGQFFSSSFETIILDASDTPHFIDLIVEHATHGKITATAFNPAGNTDASIYGVFSKG